MRQKRFRRIAAIVLLAALGAGLGLWSAAQESVPTVTYTDGADAHFSFSNTGSGSDTDLFPEFKGCMPGDSLTQTIRVQAAGSNDPLGAQIYLRAEADGDPAYDDVLRHIRITVANAAAPAVPLAGSAANRLGETAGAVLLGTVRPGEPLELAVTITVDPAMGNAFQEAAAHVTWVFSTESGDDPGTDPTPPLLETEEHFAYVFGYPDGTIHPTASITRAEVAVIFYRLLSDEARAAYRSETNDFTDTEPGAWYSVAVSSLTRIGILAGYPDGSFGPGRNITRAEFATIAMRFLKTGQTEGADRFTDISNSWARDQINAAAAHGIITGYPDGTFCPQRNITRAEAFAMVNRLLGRTPHANYLLDEMAQWPDNADPNAWYYAAVQEATNSHDYIRDGDHEVWQSLRPNKVWD